MSLQTMLAAITVSNDTTWLRQCRDYNKTLKKENVVAAADQRLRDIDLKAALAVRQGDDTLEGRVLESLRVYRELLKHKHGKAQAAGYTERDLKKFGPRDALIKTIERARKTDGLQLLAEHGRLDCAYEQIAIDFASELPPATVTQARETLGQLSEMASS